MLIAIASGKGGTGKTTVAVNLARVMDISVCLVDCDVEEPNAHLFMKGEKISENRFKVPVPEVDLQRCTGCGECSRFCQFHAIITLGTQALVFPELCHNCGGCQKVCPKCAIHEIAIEVGTITAFRSGNVTILQGKLDVGKAIVPPLIQAVKSQIPPDIHVILDAPPGTSCSVVATLKNADYVILVTEPTPFGLWDLKLAVQVVRLMNLPFGVVVNRADIGDDRVVEFCRDENIDVILSIPDDRRISEAYSRGAIIIDAIPEYRTHFEVLLKKIMQ